MSWAIAVLARATHVAATPGQRAGSFGPDASALVPVIPAAAGTTFSSQPHLHRTEFQLVYILKDWIEFEYDAQAAVRLEAGACVCTSRPAYATASWATATTSRSSRPFSPRALPLKK